jgi:hypothetical protein
MVRGYISWLLCGRSSIYRGHWYVVLVAGTSFSLARRVAHSVQDIPDIIFHVGQLHCHFLYCCGGGYRGYLFIYLFLINACNLKVMARFTELNT